MSDSDDDRPISELIKKRLPTFKPATGDRNKDKEAEPAPKKVKAETSTKVKAEKNDDREKPRKSLSSSSASIAARSQAFYTETAKGMLVQRLLVRWWYAIEWPKPEEIGQPPVGYESLEGFPGVYISTKVCCSLVLSNSYGE